MFWKYFFIIYGILCLAIGLLKPPFIFNSKKFEIMENIFKSKAGVQIFVLIWGAVSLAIGIWVFN